MKLVSSISFCPARHAVASKEEEDCAGTKKRKQRVTLLLGANTDGTGPLLVGKFTNPRCLKNVHSLPFTYKHSKKAWMTAEIWKEWLQSLDKKMAQQKWKVLLFANNCPAHLVVPRLKAVGVHFLLPNTIAVLQPMGHGVVQCFKSWYKNLLLRRMGNALGSSSKGKCLWHVCS